MPLRDDLVHPGTKERTRKRILRDSGVAEMRTDMIGETLSIRLFDCENRLACMWRGLAVFCTVRPTFLINAFCGIEVQIYIGSMFVGRGTVGKYFASLRVRDTLIVLGVPAPRGKQPKTVCDRQMAVK